MHGYRTLAAALLLVPAGRAMTSPFTPKPGAVAPSPSGASGLPHTQGQRFETLDAYLAFLRAGAAIDRPWYEEVAPDVYELRTSIRPAPPARRFTRAELERRFGFAPTRP